MIILGFPGIGKSTLAAGDIRIIDLDSSNFMTEEFNRSDDWYIYYCQTGIALSKQGYIVLMSIHDEVRRFFEIRRDGEAVYMVYPIPELKEEWIKKLEDRFKRTWITTYKDFKALVRTKKNFDSDIDEIRGTNLAKSEITGMEYKLSEIIAWLVEKEEFKNAHFY